MGLKIKNTKVAELGNSPIYLNINKLIRLKTLK
jgi:hypothetical protein